MDTRTLTETRMAEAAGETGRLRVLLLTLGVAAGMSAVSAAITLGQGARSLFSDLERAVTETARLEVEPMSGRFEPGVIDSLQATVTSAKLCPVMEASGLVPALGEDAVQVLGLDLLGDTRIPPVAPWLGTASLSIITVPTIFLPRRIHEGGRVEPGQAIEVSVNGRTAAFVVSALPLPDAFLSRTDGAVVAVDVTHFQGAFRPDGEIDRIAVVASGEAASREAELALIGVLPAGSRVLALGDGSEVAGAWVATWSRLAALLVNAVVLLGIVIVYLSGTAAYARLDPLSCRLVSEGHDRAAVAASEVAEVVGVGLAGAALGVFNGWLLTDALAGWVVGLGAWEAVTPIAAPRPPLPPLALALGTGLGVPSALALWRRLLEARSTVLTSVPRTPAAAAGILLVVASMLVVPGPGHGNLALGYAAGLLVFAAIGLLGRPLLALGASACRRAGATRWPIEARVITAQLTETPSALGVSLALVAFTFASWATFSGVSTQVRRANESWTAEAFGADVRLEGAGVRARDPMIPIEMERHIRAIPEVGSTGLTRSLAATLGGATVPLSLVSSERIGSLELERSASSAALESAASADPPAVPLYVPVALARAHGLFPGALTWIDTETGSWQALVAATYRPAVTAEPACVADAHRFLNRLSRGSLVHTMDVRFVDGVSPPAGRAAVGAALGTTAGVRFRPLDRSRPHLSRAFETARRTVAMLLGTLGVLSGAAFLSFAGGALVDVPPGWRVLAALGVPRRRIATSGAISLALMGLFALVLGALTGLVGAGALGRSISAGDLDGMAPVRALPHVLPISLLLWMLASSLVLIGMRGAAFGRAVAMFALGVLLIAPRAEGAGRAFAFPGDHGAHPDERVESWVFTGHLLRAGGTWYAYQAAFHRVDVDTAMTPDPEHRFDMRSVHPATLAITDLATGRLLHASGVERDGAGTASVGGNGVEIRHRSWRVRLRDGTWTIEASSDSIELSLALTATKPPLVIGSGGVYTPSEDGRKGAYRYAIPRLETQGSIRTGSRRFDVSGISWLDHVFGETILTEDEAGWDVLNLQIRDGAELSLYRFRSVPGRGKRRVGGAYVSASGVVMRLEALTTRFYPVGANRWVSPATHQSYPVRWRVEIPSLSIRLDVAARPSNQELPTYRTHGAAIWRGSVEATGWRGAASVSAAGFLEMVGYAGRFPPIVADRTR